MPPSGLAATQSSETQTLSQTTHISSHIKGFKLDERYNCSSPHSGVNYPTYNTGVSNCFNARNPDIDFGTCSLFSEPNFVTFDRNTSTHSVDSICVDNVACNGVLNSPNNSYNISVYSDSAVINNYRSMSSSDVSLASMFRRRGNSPQAPSNSTNSGDGFVYDSNNTNLLCQVCQNTRWTIPCIGSYPITGNHIHRVDFIALENSSLLNHNSHVVYVHPSDSNEFSGFHYITRDPYCRLRGPCVPPPGVLHVINSVWMYCFPCEVSPCDQNIQIQTTKKLAKLSYENFRADTHCWDTHGCSYEAHINNVIDKLISMQDKLTTLVNDDHRNIDPNIRSQPQLNHTKILDEDHALPVINTIPLGIEAHLDQHTGRDKICRDASIPDKITGFLNHHPVEFSFIGPDRPPATVDNIEKCLDIGNTIRQTGVPNCAQARFPLKSGLNLDKWEEVLDGYPDKMLLQYLKFGFPLSLTHPEHLHNTRVKNHYSANQHPVAIQEYLQKEIQLGAILGPTPLVDSKHFHCSPLLTRPKDLHKRRVILNLSHPYGSSVNDQVSKTHFDSRKFTLRFPAIDDIVQKNLKTDDPLIYKIDVARAFRNLRVDPVDAVKFGIYWDNHFYLDQSVAFGWTHGSATFQMVSDTIAYVMRESGASVFAYIDDYIGVSLRGDTMHHFRQLHGLLQDLGLPINTDKLTPPCKDLICLGIRIQIPKASLSIDPHKLRAIHDECLHVSHRTYLSKKNFQSLLGKLLYVHKCVVPARIFINRMLDLFRKNVSRKKIHLTTEFFKDLQWFKKILPQFNGVTIYKKPTIDEADALHLDACLTGIGGIWHDRVYSSPAPVIPGFELKIVHLEMINVLVALRIWGKFWQHSQVKIYCDNLAVVQVVANSKTRDPFLGACIRNLWLAAAHLDILLQVEHIRGEHNVRADLLSRMYSDKPVNEPLLQTLRENFIWDRVLPDHFNLDLDI